MSAVLAEAVFRALVRRAANKDVPLFAAGAYCSLSLATMSNRMYQRLIISTFVLLIYLTRVFTMPVDRTPSMPRRAVVLNRKPRVSEPQLPPAPLITPRTEKQKRRREFFLLEQEPSRIAANKNICALLADMEANPEDWYKRFLYDTAVEDYEIDFCKFVPDSEVEVVVSQMDAATAKIEKLRTAIKYGNVVAKSDAVCAYMAAIKQFHTDFGVSYESQANDGADADIALKCEMIQLYVDRVKPMDSFDFELRVGTWEMEMLFINPHRLDDPRRLQLDARLRKLVAGWKKVPADSLPPFDDHKGILFRLFNDYSSHPRDLAAIERYLQMSIYYQTLNRLQNEAYEAAKTVVPSKMPRPRAVAEPRKLREFKL
ncbi:hypothetical protein R3P38DRAFT_3201457 [Favolaschia claudopus]|uniref:Uncharacterized protein n=1 Tax=Favolaschia claudopus TaxID=2862362 RepID=A0AAW0AXL0_9AGAR